MLAGRKHPRHLLDWLIDHLLGVAFWVLLGGTLRALDGLGGQLPEDNAIDVEDGDLQRTFAQLYEHERGHVR